LKRKLVENAKLKRKFDPKKVWGYNRKYARALAIWEERL